MINAEECKKVLDNILERLTSDDGELNPIIRSIEKLRRCFDV
jgi:DNA-binding FrmR family transcriptional regulator